MPIKNYLNLSNPVCALKSVYTDKSFHQLRKKRFRGVLSACCLSLQCANKKAFTDNELYNKERNSNGEKIVRDK